MALVEIQSTRMQGRRHVQEKTVKQEASIIWELANQLGVTAAEDQGRMVDRFMEMEERDRMEADKVGNKSCIL